VSREESALPLSPDEPDHEELLAQIPAILYTADRGAGGRWHYVSPQIETILGYSPQEWCADPTLWAQRLHPDDAARVLAYEDDPGRDGEDAIEYRLRHRDGRIVWVRDDAILRPGADGVPRWQGLLSQITDRKLAEAELELRAAQQAAVARLGEHALEGMSITDLCHEAVAAGTRLLDVEIGAVLELLPGREQFRLLAARGLPEPATSRAVPAGRLSQAGYTLLARQPVIVTDWDTEDRFQRSAVLTSQHARSGITVAVEGRTGPYGVLGLHSATGRRFKPSDVDFAVALANVLGDAFEHKLTAEDIRHRALHDPLTGLPNRILFVDRLAQAIARLRRRSGTSAVLLVDLDRFKLINESLGHDAGDELLAAAALRLKHIVRSSDTVARFGADTFGILLEEISGEHDAIEMAQRIAGVFTRPFVLGGDEHFLTASLGIALTGTGERADDLMRDAEAAMHRAKDRGRARYELFDERIRGRAIFRLRVDNDLRRALERDEFMLHYQPLVSLGDLSIVGVEALLRWEHPQRGQISPAEFIPVAEENGLINPLGRWVLDHACRQAADWSRMRPDAPPVSMSVNLSVVQFRHPGLVEAVAGALRESALDPELLTLELTESVMERDVEGLGEALEALKALGVRLVLDDFGTGYSSLSYLTRLPLDALKVDRSFVDGLGSEPRDTAVTEAIVAMSRALSLKVVGEGTETELQVTELARLGCDLAQGFHFSRPVPAQEITRMLQAGPAWLNASPDAPAGIDPQR